MKKRLALLLTGMVLVAGSLASAVTAGAHVSETIAGNYQCGADDTKIEPVVNGTYALVGGGWITITVGWDNGAVFSFDTNGTATVSSMVVKGGPNHLLWSFNPAVEEASGLHAPLNLKNPNGYWYGLSHLCINSEKKDGDPGNDLKK